MEPKYLKLGQLLQGRLFRIPEYQRTYSWTSRQREDLFGDIERLMVSGDPGRSHFMATVACLRQPTEIEIGTDSYEDVAVVDGQQRLTTLIVLLKTVELKLSSLAPGADPEDDTAARAATELRSLLVKQGKAREVLLQTNHDNSLLFRRFLQTGEPPKDEELQTAADENLRNACRECAAFVDKLAGGNAGRILELTRLLKSRLTFVFYELEDEATVYRVFETLNSRGLVVDALDKCKSMLMAITAEKSAGRAKADVLDELHKTWSAIYKTIGLDEVDGEELLRFSATLWKKEDSSRVLSAADSLELLRTSCTSGDIETIHGATENMLRVGTALRRVLAQPDKKAVTEIVHARLLAVAIDLAPGLTDAEKAVALEQWERVTFRIFGLNRKDARTKVGDYTRLACRVFAGRDPLGRRYLTLSLSAVLTALRTIGKDYPADQAADRLRTENCYEGWETELRYFMYRYEQHLAAAKPNDVVWNAIWRDTAYRTIEHVFPESPSGEWQPRYSAQAEEQLRSQIGNLVILPQSVNSAASNKPFAEKKTVYRNNGAAGLFQIAEVLSEEEWGKDQILARGERLIAWAKTRWADLPGNG